MNRLSDFAGGTVFTKRMSRKTYWISVGVLAGVVVLISVVPVLSNASWGLSFVWFLIWAPRLHDFGRSAWLMVIPVAVQIGVGIAGIALGGDTFEKIMMGDVDAISQNDPGALVFVLVMLAVLAVQIAFTVLVGIPSGDPGPNRFGDAPKS